MKNVWLLLFYFSFLTLYGQKTKETIINNPSIQSIIINGDAIFKIKVNTTQAKQITLSAKIDGEYAKNTFIITEIKNDTLNVSSTYHALMEKANDKLSAHKVTSIDVALEIPEDLTFYFKSEIASAEIIGNYKNLLLELNQGNANLKQFTGNAIINTLHGNITLETNFATIAAFTKTGVINKEPITKAENEIIIHSIHGDITVVKSN